MVLVRQKSKVSRGFQFVNTKRQPLYTPQFNISQTHVTSVSNISTEFREDLQKYGMQQQT